MTVDSIPLIHIKGVTDTDEQEESVNFVLVKEHDDTFNRVINRLDEIKDILMTMKAERTISNEFINEMNYMTKDLINYIDTSKKKSLKLNRD